MAGGRPQWLVKLLASFTGKAHLHMQICQRNIIAVAAGSRGLDRLVGGVVELFAFFFN